jgi:isopentenyldiphosphate isomerase
MKKKKVKIGLAPTRRNVFSVEDSLKYKKLIENKLREWEIDFVNLDSLNKEGLLFNRHEADGAAKIFPPVGAS